MRSAVLLTIQCVAMLPACAGDNVPECSVVLSDPSVPLHAQACDAARSFAARDSPVLAVRQSQLTRYYERYLRAIAAEPLMFSADRDPERIVIQTSSWRIAEQWRNGERYTGDESFDAIIDDVDLTFDPTRGNEIVSEFSDWRHNLGFRTGRLAAPSLLNQQLQSSTSRLLYISPFSQLSTTWFWERPSPGDGSDDGIAVITYPRQVPTGLRILRAVVSATSVQVYDVAGEPFPPGESLAPTTIPWPYD
jgi:hypothetical protein